MGGTELNVLRKLVSLLVCSICTCNYVYERREMLDSVTDLGWFHLFNIHAAFPKCFSGCGVQKLSIH